MTLAPGTQLGSHEIVGLLGQGGMGEVYRARDTRLNREVAIKVLPAAYASDPDRVARFEREAQAVAALNHPRIAAIYDFSQADDIRFLVLELVEGETLADRLRRGPIPLDEALDITIGICEALEAAHEKGICHRDLKPANIKLTQDGAVKVLDFGLAKILHDNPSHASLTNSPTLSLPRTIPGVILGTAGYMSPEQAKGSTADHRSDIFSLGCILYELLTGRQAFEGESASEILAAVIKSEPDLTRLPPRLNPRLLELLRRCLEKQPRSRWHSIADVRVEVDNIRRQGVLVSDERAATRTRWRRALPVAAGVLAGAVAGGAVAWMYRREPAGAVTRFSLTLPEGQAFQGVNRHLVSLSPDGSQLAYAANERLFVRTMADPEPRLIAGTEGARAQLPVFSPDGRSIAFWSAADNALKRIAVSGGAAVTIATGISVAPFGVSWSEHGLVFAQVDRGIVLLSPNGGTQTVVVAPRDGETVAAPRILPGGRHILFTAAQGADANRWDAAHVAVQRIGDPERKVVLEGGADASYVPTGHLVYALSGILLAVPFDLNRLEVTGGPTSVLEGVRRTQYTSNSAPTAQYSVSANGSLAYLSGPTSIINTITGLALIDRDGRIEPLKVPPAAYQAPRASPDGRFIAVGTDDGKEAVIWVYELAGASSIRRLTFNAKDRYPLWSPDSQWIAFQSDRGGDLGIFRQRADGTGNPEQLTKTDAGDAHIPTAWSGDRLVYTAGKAPFTLWTLTLSDKRTARWGNVQATYPPQASISADGRWIAYQSNESGTPELYVQPFPEGGAKYTLPRDINNHHPIWSPDGRELFYIPSQGVTVGIGVTTTPRVSFGTPTPLQRGGRLEGSPAAHRNSDILPDGKRFVGVVMPSSSPGGAIGNQIHIVLNWFEDLRQRAPAR